MKGYLIFLSIILVSIQKKHITQKVTLKGDHFFSGTAKTKTYLLDNIQQKKSLLVFLKRKNEEDQVDTQEKVFNPVTVEISDDKGQNQKCEFTSYDHLCMLSEVKSKLQTRIKITCQNVPCDVTFKSLQADTINATFDVVKPAQIVYTVNKNNTMITVFCNDSQIVDFSSKINVYSSVNHTVLNEGNLLLFIFNGYLDDLIILKKRQVSKCTNIKFQQIKNNAQFNNKSQIAVVLNETEIKVNKIPDRELRIDLSVTQFNMKKLESFNITIYGFSGNNQKKLIETFVISEMEKEPDLDLDIILKKNKFNGFTSFSFKITSKQPLLIHYSIQDADIHALDIEEESYFNIDKDQTIQFDIVTTKQNSKQKIEAKLLDETLNTKVQLNLSCSENTTCRLIVKAKQAVQVGVGVIYKRENQNQQSYIPLVDEISLSLNEGQIKYLLHNNSNSTSKVITVSTNNVLVYAAGEKCPRPSSKCFQYSGNLKHMIAIQDYDGPLYIAVQGLQLTHFVLTVNDKNDDIELMDGVPLAINMQKDLQLVFKFRLKQKQSTYFNLIAPPNTFQMYISNSEEQPDVQDLDLITSTDFIHYPKSMIDELVFTILIKPKISKQNQQFTIIASTKDTVILLDRAEPHYDLLKPDQTKKYALLVSSKQIQQKTQLGLHIDVFQKLSHFNLTLKLGKTIAQLDKQIDVTEGKVIVNIHQYVEDICDQQQEDESVTDICYVYLSLQNHNSKQIDVTLTTLLENSIIQLIPGIWQSYTLNDLTSTNYFYFVPTNDVYPIYLMFSHSFGVIKLKYNLFNNKDKIQNAGDWPFPNNSANSNTQVASNNFQIHEYTIEIADIKKCFPDCLLLVTLENGIPDKQISKDVLEALDNQFGTYSIMATDSLVEIVESQKISIGLNKDQVKIFTIPLTQYLKLNKTLTFLVSDVIGFHQIFGEFTTNRLDNLPDEASNDFKIEGFETQLSPQQISQKLKAKNLDTHQQVDLLLYIKCTVHCKFIFEFTTKEQYIQQLYFGLPNTVNLLPNSQKIFSVTYFVNYKLKFTRARGFPIIVWSQCQENQLQACYDQLKAKENKPMLSKTLEIPIKHQFGTKTFLRIYSKEQGVQLEVVAISDLGSVQLKQGVPMTDFLSANGTNVYKINTVIDQDAIITINVFEGKPSATLRDPKRNFNHTKETITNTIQFHIYNYKNQTEILQQIQKNQTDQDGIAPANRYQANYNQFSQVTLEITDQVYNASYSIVYTLGQRHQDLIDGLLGSAKLNQNQTVTYNYINEKNTTAIVTISFMNAQMMQNCQITLFSYDWQQESEPVQTKIQRMKMNNKTPRPSITFNLDPKFVDYEIKLKNKYQKQIQLQITVNHMDLIYLPFGYQYPNYIQKNQSAYFIAEVMNKGYVEVIIKKCSESDLTFSYAVHDKTFLNDTYAFEQKIEQMRFVNHIKAEESRIYFRLESQQGALYSILVNRYDKKTKGFQDDLKAGDKGQVAYNILANNKAQITFAPVVCKKQCNKINYFYLINSDRSQVENQIACPGSFFANTATPIVPLLPKPIKYTKENDKYKFTVDMLPEGMSFLGVKAITSEGRQIVYHVIQLQSFWGGIAANKSYHIGILGLLLFCFGFILCLVCRRRFRMAQKYEDVPQLQA